MDHSCSFIYVHSFNFSVQIWALAPAVDESEYVSAAADSKIIVWKDVSTEQKEEEEKERRRKVNEEQVSGLKFLEIWKL